MFPRAYPRARPVLPVESMLVGGGGSGGGNPATGAGGAGEFLIRTHELTQGTYPAAIGPGGIAPISGLGGVVGLNGGDTTFAGLRARGGGGGGPQWISSGGVLQSGNPGGSGGGGGSGDDTLTHLGPGGASTADLGLGNAGGAGSVANAFGAGGGGGGGAGGTGASGTTNPGGANDGGKGGDGILSSFTGSALPYAAGGSGYNKYGQPANDGGPGDGGNGGGPNFTGTDGTAGQLVVKYLTADKVALGLTITGGTTTVVGAYTLHTFTSSADLVVS